MEIKPQYSHSKLGNALFYLCASWAQFLVKHRVLYYLLAATWGGFLTVIGIFVTAFLALVKLFGANIAFTPYYWIYHIALGPRGWGGLEFGLTFLRSPNCDSSDAHEFGHTFQNTILGPLFIPMVAIPSAIWYWSRIVKKGYSKPYDSMWFEDSASQIGLYVCQYLNNNTEQN